MLTFNVMVEMHAGDPVSKSVSYGRLNFGSSMSPKAQELRLRYEVLQATVSRSVNSDLINRSASAE